MPGDRPRDHDLVIISDLDEFLPSATMRHIIAHPPSTWFKLRCDAYYYSLRYKASDKHRWVHPIVARWGFAKLQDFDQLWKNRTKVLAEYRAVHASYMFGTVEGIKRKLESFSHTSYGRWPYTDIDRIFSRMTCGVDLFTQEPVVSGWRPIAPSERWNETEYPILRHPDFKWMNTLVPFREVPKTINVTKMEEWNACERAFAAVRDIENEYKN